MSPLHCQGSPIHKLSIQLFENQMDIVIVDSMQPKTNGRCLRVVFAIKATKVVRFLSVSHKSSIHQFENQTSIEIGNNPMPKMNARQLRVIFAILGLHVFSMVNGSGGFWFSGNVGGCS